jgi:Raf kinase inhibitor-like YbhB/YbcL family protein
MEEIRRSFPFLLLLGVLVLAAIGCGAGESPTATPLAPTTAVQEQAPSISFSVTSAAFSPGDPIPVKYTCDGDDISPPLEWGDPPSGTQSFALIADDPDAPAGTWLHWVLYDLPASARGLPEAVPPDAELADGGRHGQNSWKRLGYGGPCPPSGTHRYFFKLFALDTKLGLDPNKGKDELLQAMEVHVLAQTELMGTYTR